MKLPFGFGDLDLTDWVRGLVAAFIGGGASAVSAGFVVSINDPGHYAPGAWKFYELVISVFFMSGLLNAMMFLRSKPLPDLIKTVTTEKVIARDGIPTRSETIKETTVISPGVPPTV